MEGSGVAGRLEEDVDAAETAQPGAVERGADLGGVMAVVVDDGDALLLAADLETAIDTAERGERLADDVGLDLEFHGDRDGGHRVQDVVAAGDAEVEAAEGGGSGGGGEGAREGAAGGVGGLDCGRRRGPRRGGAAGGF